MAVGLEPDCPNVQNMLTADKENLLNQHKLPLDILDVKGAYEKGVHIYWSYSKSQEKPSFNTLAYKRKDKTALNLFSFHYDLAQKLNKDNILPYDALCFKDNKFAYIVFSPKKYRSNLFTVSSNVAPSRKLTRATWN